MKGQCNVTACVYKYTYTLSSFQKIGVLMERGERERGERERGEIIVIMPHI